MKRHSDNSIIPKIIIFLGTVSILGIILLFLRPRPQPIVRAKRPDTPEKLFAQVIEAARPQILKLWAEGDRFFPKTGVKCDAEIVHDNSVGRSYYQCNPHFWQCYWQKGVNQNPVIEVDLFGQTFHVAAKASFDPVSQISSQPRYHKSFKRTHPEFPQVSGELVELEVREIRGLTQPMVLVDSCRDTYLPQRIYGYGKAQEGLVWDNFDRHLFLDRFYVTNRQVNEWRILTGEAGKIESDRKKWPLPALVSAKEQADYCAFYGKRVLEAKLFDAAAMSPSDLKNPLPDRVLRPETPWQRDVSKTFLGMSRINPDYQLTPLDCQLAQVQGCKEKYFSTDSATWMGLHFTLGFNPEHLVNHVNPKLNLKLSSRKLAPASPWHELGKLSTWSGTQDENLPVAFRCYEEVVP